MRIVSFGPDAGHHVDRFGSDFVLARLTGGAELRQTVCLHLGAGGSVGEHEAVADQLFCVVSGAGWVSGGDGGRRPIAAFEAALWDEGERHGAGTESGLVAIVLEGTGVADGAPASGSP